MRDKNAYKVTKFIDQLDKTQDKTRYTWENPKEGKTQPLKASILHSIIQQ